MRKILIADPNAAFATFIGDALREMGAFSVTIASSGPEARQVCAEIEPDLAVIDVDLPDCQPAALIADLRASVPNLPVVFLPYTKEAVPPGVVIQGVLTKPFFLPDLSTLINSLLGPVPEPHPPARPPAPSALPIAPSKKLKAKLTEEDLRLVAAHVEALSHAVRGEPVLLTRSTTVVTITPHLSQSASAALAAVVASARKGAGSTEVIRFEGDSETTRYMLYSLGIVGDLALSLALRVRLPLPTVRKLVRDAAAEIAALVTD